MQNKNDNRSMNDDLATSLGRERDKLQQAIEQLRQEIEEKTRERRFKEERLDHVQALLASEPPVNDERVRSRRRTSSLSTPSPQLLDMAVQVLRERKGDPMHYRDLADEIVKRARLSADKIRRAHWFRA